MMAAETAMRVGIPGAGRRYGSARRSPGPLFRPRRGGSIGPRRDPRFAFTILLSGSNDPDAGRARGIGQRGVVDHHGLEVIAEKARRLQVHGIQGAQGAWRCRRGGIEERSGEGDQVDAFGLAAQ